jgi:hypothetical protein
MSTITRNCINPEILLHEHDPVTNQLINTLDYEDFCNFIDRWKVLLVKKYNAKPGQTICPLIGPTIFYHALIFAAAELGLILIVDWPHVYHEEDLDDAKLYIHGKVDFIFTTLLLHTPGDSNYSRWMTQRDLITGNVIFYVEDIHDYFAQVTEQDIADLPSMAVTEDSPFIYSCSSGTTGDPKRIINSHKKVCLMSERIAHLLIEPDSKVLHTVLLHHGASIGIHFLPGFMYGKEQYTFATGGCPPKLVQFIADQKINQLFLYTNNMLNDFLRKTDVLDHKVNIVTLYQITADLLPLIKQKKVNFVKSLFGDATIGTGFFIKTVDQSTDQDTYDVLDMGPPLDDFYQFEIRDNRLYVASQQLNEDWTTSDDLFCLVDGNYCFQGRANQYRINGQWIELNTIEDKVKKLFGLHGANIVIDADMQKIYLAVWQENSAAEQELDDFFKETFNNELTVSYVLRNEPTSRFQSSRKIDQAKIRMVCRKKIMENLQ